jgi:hypothetical protein
MDMKETDALKVKGMAEAIRILAELREYVGADQVDPGEVREIVRLAVQGDAGAAQDLARDIRARLLLSGLTLEPGRDGGASDG